jgi:hypothetical protein
LYISMLRWGINIFLVVLVLSIYICRFIMYFLCRESCCCVSVG